MLCITVAQDGGKLPHPDGRPTHTFRSCTAFFSGERLRVEDLTIENDAGPGAKAGQAVAAYVDSAHAVFEKVRLLGNQDTLFCAPLPEKEREKDGFLGPRGPWVQALDETQAGALLCAARRRCRPE